MKSLPEIKMVECRVKTNMYREVLFTVMLPFYRLKQDKYEHHYVILPTGTHLSFGLYEDGKPTVLVNGPGWDKLMAALRHCQETGEPFGETPPEWFLIHRMVEDVKASLARPKGLSRQNA